MPHIDQDNYYATKAAPQDAGELTFVLYDTVCNYVVNEPEKRLRYQRICEVRGALVGTLSEFDRLVAHPYEDTAIARNGDATPIELHLMLQDAQRQEAETLLPKRQDG